MQVWNMLHGARCKYRAQKVVKKAPSGHHHTTFVRLYLRNYGMFRQSEKKLVKQQYLLQTWPQYGELRPTIGWDSSGRQPNFAALNRGHHLYSAGRPSRWALAHILVWSAVPHVYPLSLPFCPSSAVHNCTLSPMFLVSLWVRLEKTSVIVGTRFFYRTCPFSCPTISG